MNKFCAILGLNETETFQSNSVLIVITQSKVLIHTYIEAYCSDTEKRGNKQIEEDILDTNAKKELS
jgi:hypothetical protein